MEKAGALNEQAANREDVTAPEVEDDTRAKQKRKKKSKSNKKPLQGAGTEAEVTYEGVVHVFVL